jgi:hypothetical protein
MLVKKQFTANGDIALAEAQKPEDAKPEPVHTFKIPPNRAGASL